MALARFTSPSDMEPLLPSGPIPNLVAKATLLIKSAAELGCYFAPETRQAVADLVRSMNGYYSNLIEGHRTRPADIEAALAHQFSTQPQRRELQLLHYAHLETQLELERRLRDEPEIDFLSPEFICWLHGKFYSFLPESLRQVTNQDGKTYPVKPGELRDYDVHVGIHLAPAFGSLDKFLARFREFYGPYRTTTTPEAVIAAMAAHHRLAWIHPFGDGNGRVTRLLTHAWLTRIGLGANGLWTISRGLARNLDQYKEALAAADNKRLNDYDGRGYLSERRLTEFCTFMIDQALDQTKFMHGLLDFRQLEKRLIAYCSVAEQAKELPKRSGLLLRDVMLRGSIPRGDAARILNVSARTAQTVTRDLLSKGLMKSPSPKGQLTIGFPGFICPTLFPDLYPTGSPP
jgi:Fic family protein